MEGKGPGRFLKTWNNHRSVQCRLATDTSVSCLLVHYTLLPTVPLPNSSEHLPKQRPMPIRLTRLDLPDFRPRTLPFVHATLAPFEMRAGEVELRVQY